MGYNIMAAIHACVYDSKGFHNWAETHRPTENNNKINL
jgi:hypothetical protein